MEEKYFKERREKFDEICNEKESNKNEQKLSLRKIKNNEALMSKRIKLLSDKKIYYFKKY